MASKTMVSTTKSSKGVPERRKAGGGIVAFASQKGVARSIRNYKYRKEVRVGKKAALLRGYQKVMKQEGYGTNVTRKRRNNNNNDINNNNNNNNNEHGNEEDKQEQETQEAVSIQETDKGLEKMQKSKVTSTNVLPGRKQKMNPWAKSLEKAKQAKEMQEKARAEREEMQQLKAKKERQRRKQAKLLSQKTSRGQPVMKHIIHGLLSKIEEQKKR